MPKLTPKSEADHNKELEAYQRQLDRNDSFEDRLDGIEIESSGHSDVAPTVTRRMPARPTLAEQDGDPNE